VDTLPIQVFAELNREAMREIAPQALAVLPLGATEQHGPHLPSGTDTLAVESIARDAAEIAARSIPVMLTPALPFGSSAHHLVYGATLSLSTETYYKVLCDLLESLVQDGFSKIFLLNGHGGNHELAQLAARDVALRQPVRIAAGSYWTIAWEALTAAGAHGNRRLPGHAGDFETSVILSLRPELVSERKPHRDDYTSSDPRRPEAAWRHEKHGFWTDIEGFTDSPDQANAARGSEFRKIICGSVANAFLEFYSS
jgi:creatinine amidohydrolase